MDETRRLALKLSDEARQLWADTLRLFAHPNHLSYRTVFNGLSNRLARLPRNQQRYYRQLVALHSDQFLSSDLLGVGPERFEEMIENMNATELQFMCLMLSNAHRDVTELQNKALREDPA